MQKYALISVFDKTGVVEFAKGLVELGYSIISTGGTKNALKAEGLSVVDIEEVTGFPECLDGRVKTLHPKVHAGLLALRDNAEHMEFLQKAGIAKIDVVAVNLYPFKKTISNPDVEFDVAVENIDIGGPTMLRSAAKNYQFVMPVIDPVDYPRVVEHLKSGKDDIKFRIELMRKVFMHTAAYDALIAGYLAKKLSVSYPEKLTLTYEKAQGLRYGENPHQSAAYYKESFVYHGALPFGTQLAGKELSYNNINDANAAISIVKEFSEPCASAIKHANPCGVATGETIDIAYKKAFEADPISIFGGIVALNRECSEELAKELVKIFLEIVIAPAFSEGAMKVFNKKPNLRVIRLENIECAPKEATIETKKILGGLLVQELDTTLYNEQDLTVVTKLSPSEQQMRDLEFAFKIVKHAKSNAIVIAKNGQTLGIGSGQTNRIWAANHAIEQTNGESAGAVMASDAFFPFPDCVEVAADAGITAIIQPGGSINDAKSIEACNERGLSMVFCGQRHFKH